MIVKKTAEAAFLAHLINLSWGRIMLVTPQITFIFCLVEGVTQVINLNNTI